MELDFGIRQIFERYAQQGTRPYEFNLQRLAGGEYVSSHTEHHWRTFRNAYKLGDLGESHPETDGMCVPKRQTHISTKKSSRASKNQ